MNRYLLVFFVSFLFSDLAFAGRTINSATVDGGATTSVAQNATISININVTTDGSGSDNDWKSTGWRIDSSTGPLTCENHSNFNFSGTHNHSFDITAPNTDGDYNLYLVAYQNNNCSDGASGQFVLSNAVTVGDTEGNICSSTFSNENSGTVYDSGGASQAYSNNENCGFLIQPTSSPDNITLSFSQFELEQNYDFFRVYDGSSAAGTLLGTFTGSSIPNAVTATSGSMYLQFISDFSVTRNGFTASWESTAGACPTDNVQDTFPSPSYNHNNGSQNWAAAWQEVGESDGLYAGQARVDNGNCSSAYCLRIGTPSGVSSGQYTNRGASREVDLSNASSATLTFNYFTGFGGGTANVSLQVSNDGGSNWATLQNYPINSTSFSADPESFDLTPYLAANTQIRFIGSGSSGSNTGMYIDDINIDYEHCPPLIPIAEYRFDACSFTERVEDTQGNFHGIATGTDSSEIESVLGGRSLDLSATSTTDWVTLPKTLLNNIDDFSFSIWVKTAHTSNQQEIFHALGSGTDDDELEIALRSNDTIYVKVRDDSSSLNSNINLTDNIWHHVLVTRDDRKVCLYIDGQQQECENNEVRSGQLSVNHDHSIVLGQKQDRLRTTSEQESGFSSSQSFKGFLDELKLYQSIPSSSEIATLYANEAAGKNADGSIRSPLSCSTLNHFEISYAKAGLTCLPSSITIKACADAACTTVITDDVDVTFSPATGWANNPVTIANGQATLNLNHPTPGNLPLSITASSITPANNTLSCLADSNPDPTCSIDVAETGFIFDVPTLTACQPSANVTIKAVKTDDDTAQCISVFSNTTKTLSFSSEYNNPTTGTKPVKIINNNGDEIVANDTGNNIDLNFDNNGEAQFTVQYDDGNGLSMTKTDSFVSTPVAIVSYSEDSNADCASQSANCSVFKKAGEAFNQTIKAACWNHDNDTDYTDNPTTPNFVLASIGINSNVLAPTGGANGQLKENSFNFSASDQGIHTLEQTISEVGVFEFSLTVPTYFTETLNSVNSPAIGRFIPDHFKTTTGNDGSFGSACTSFSYSGQTFSYQTNPQLIVTAYNSETPETITQNYRGDFAKLDDTDLIPTTPVADANQLGADNTNLVKLDWDPRAATLNDNGDGTHTLTFGNDNYTYKQEANSQIAPFVNDVDLTFTQIRDSDSVSASTLPHTLQPSGENIYFGRVALDSAHGSELAPLAVGLRTEYFNGTGWLPNTQDQCTSISLTNHIRLKVDGGSFQAGNSTMTIQSGTTSATLANSLISGDGSLSLSAPGEDNQGYVDIRTNMNATHPWLVDIINGEAQSRASFGLFRGDNKIIFRRERY